MTEKLLVLIECPECKGNFILRVSKRNASEIRRGILHCRGCGSKFSISNGILNLLLKPSRTVIKEQKAIREVVLKKERLTEACDDTWLLSLPFPKTMGKNPKVLPMMHNEGINFTDFLKQLRVCPGETVLDIGAGNCWTTNLIAKSGASCVALDISKEKYAGLGSADVYIRHNKVYFERVLADMNHLPFRNGTFDVVFSCAALHHTSHLEKTCQEISRVLKIGGRLALISEANVSILRKNSFYSSNSFIRERKDGFNENAYTVFEWTRAIKKAGISPKVSAPRTVDADVAQRLACSNILGAIWNLMPQKLKRLLILVSFHPVMTSFGATFNLWGVKRR